MSIVGIILSLAVTLWIIAVLFPAMALRRNTNPFVWIVVTVWFTPLASIPLLLLLGRKSA